MSPRHLTSLLVLTALCAPASAQKEDAYWVAYRSSRDAYKFSACGELLAKIRRTLNRGGD